MSTHHEEMLPPVIPETGKALYVRETYFDDEIEEGEIVYYKLESQCFSIHENGMWKPIDDVHKFTWVAKDDAEQISVWGWYNEYITEDELFLEMV